MAGQPCCTFCGVEINEGSDYREVRGYERIHRAAGGTNRLRLREAAGKFACRSCIDKQAKGIAPTQASLL